MPTEFRANINKLTSSEAVLAAIAECDALGREEFLKKYGFGPARTLPLLHGGKVYDSKAIAGVAYGIQHGTFLTSQNFTGGLTTVARTLTSLGFPVDPLPHPASWLVRGRVYERKELRERYGGQLQAGIWTPANHKAIFLFTGSSGEHYGYSDKWTSSGTYEYTGEGQSGDMTFRAGNKAIRDHRKHGRDLLLFRDEGKGKGVRYEGLFECAGWTTRRAPDRDGIERNVIVFELAPVSSAEEQPGMVGQQVTGRSLEELRQAAYAAFEGSSKDAGPKGSSSRNWYARSEAVRTYVLARAAGTCECCDSPAPFQNKAGEPYLEPHHTTRRADNGLDHPEHVAGVCPDCHRHVHFGIDGAALNDKLKAKVRAKELALSVASIPLAA